MGTEKGEGTTKEVNLRISVIVQIQISESYLKIGGYHVKNNTKGVIDSFQENREIIQRDQANTPGGYKEQYLTTWKTGEVPVRP